MFSVHQTDLSLVVCHSRFQQGNWPFWSKIKVKIYILVLMGFLHSTIVSKYTFTYRCLQTVYQFNSLHFAEFQYGKKISFYIFSIITNPLKAVVALCITRFNIKKFYVLSTEYIYCVWYGCQNKHLLFPHTLTDCFL